MESRFGIVRKRRAGDVASLARILQGSSRRRRVAALGALSTLEPQRAAAPVTLALRDPDRRVREAAATALGALKPPGEPTEALLLALEDKEESVRRAAAMALIDSRHPRALRVLVEGIHSSNRLVRDATIDGLRALRQEQRAGVELVIAFEQAEWHATESFRLGHRSPARRPLS